MKKLKTRIYDTAEFLSTEKDMAAYLEAALYEGDPSLVVKLVFDGKGKTVTLNAKNVYSH
jgi:DNA-binding phage protein